MSPRELVILLLGLAIVAVVLRGLYVAIQARRGQIRLAIDKNIPRDIDLESLEMAELPSGGARVVHRGNADNERVAKAEARAREMDLDADADVPVLMDAVQVRTPVTENPVAAEDNEVEQDDFDARGSDIPEADEDPDAVLMDYGHRSEASDNLSAVAPDYGEQETDDDYIDEAYEDSRAEWDEGQDFDADHDADDGDEDYEPVEDYESDEFEEYDGDSHVDDEEAIGDLDEHGEEDEEDEEDENGEEITRRNEPSLGNLDDDLDDFSMTAGERIGFEGQKRPAPARQTSLFDDAEEPLPESGEKKKRKSLFAAFSRKKADAKPADTQAEAARPRAGVRVEPEAQSRPQPVPQAEPEPQAPTAASSPEPQSAPAPETSYVGQPTEVLVINIMAREGRQFRGDDLLHILISAGLKFGDMNIFHQRLSRDANSPVIFSVANILNPGTFDLNAMDSFSTVGISFFLALPSPINNLDALEKMLNTAEQIRSALDGELKDDNRNGMTAQTIEHYRQRVRDFELKQLKAAGGRA